MQRAERPEVRLLDEVFLGSTGAEGSAESPDDRLRGSNEVGNCHVVALDRCRDVTFQVVFRPHDSIVAVAAQSGQLSWNPERMVSDRIDVMCEPWQVAISARLDGETSPVEPRLLDAHLSRCAPCRAYLAAAESTRRSCRLEPAPAMPDMSRPVAKANAMADRAASWSIVRALLAVVAIEVIAFSVKALVVGDANAASTHAARHLGAFSCAYGIGLLVVVVRPARARTMLPVAAVLAGALGITAIIDVAQGRVPFISETTHLPELISVLLIWLLAAPASDHRMRRSSESSPPLRSIDTDGQRDPPTRTAGE